MAKQGKNGHKPNQDQSGFNLIETTIVLMIVGLVISGVWMAGATVWNNMRKNDLTQQLMLIVTNVRNIYSGQSSLADMTPETLISAGAFPSDMLRNRAVWHAYNNRVVVSPTGTGLNDLRFYIRFDNVPRDACIDILTKTSASEQIRRQIGLLSIQTQPGAPEPVRAPIPPSMAASMCGGNNLPAESQIPITIQWVFDLR